MKIRLQASRPETEEYLMIGLSSSLADYRISHLINRQFNTCFVKRPDISFYSKDGLIGLFTYYFFHDEDLRLDYFLFSNKHDGKAAISSYKHFEYFLLIKHSSFSIHADKISSKLRRIAGISAAIKIPLEKLKNFDEILEDIELHQMEINSKTQKDAITWLWCKK